MPTTYNLISSVTVGSGGTTAINFTSIPQTYTDLVIKLSTRMSTQDYRIKYNGSASGYNVVFLYSDGSAPSSFRSSVAGYIGLTNNNSNIASSFGNSEIYIPNYTLSNAKAVSQFGVQETDASTPVYMSISAQSWSIANAITSIEISQYTGGTIYQYSTAYLYGISNA
jgi:hypothetical protein